MEALALALEGSALGSGLRRSLVLYPAVNLVHLTGLVMLVGGIGLLDLRILGFGRTVPLVALSRFVTPIAITGLLLMAASGVLMLAPDASGLIRSPLFLAKMTLVAVGVINALLFRRLFGHLERAPGRARLMALGSLAIWLTVAGLGRWVGYV